MKKSFLLSLLFVASSTAFAGSPSDWKITQPAWTEQHEALFGQFVTRIATAIEKRQCGTVTNCLQSSANMYYGTDPAGLNYTSDCADWPYYLRAYFAWKNGLPFSFESALTARPLPTGQAVTDIRYSPQGNLITKRMDLLTKKFLLVKTTFPNAVEILNETLVDTVSTASYRMSGLDEGDNFSDLYPVKISRDAIRPGTVVYDPNGHAAIIYKITDEGRLFYMDAHPDNSLTTGMYTPKFERSNPNQGAGFKNFRPLTLVDGKADSAGFYYGGRIVGTPNSQLPLFGTEQFFGTNPDQGGQWSKGTFIVNNTTVGYYDYVRLKLTLGAQHLDPIEDLKNLASDICSSLKDRVAAVDAARTSGVQLKPHPDTLPMNIYGSDGEWESFATPSRDARLKVSFVDLLNSAKSSIAKYRAKDPSIKYTGTNLAQDLFQAYAQTATACQFSYYTSSGKSVLMNLEAARQRLFNMSFDPYHCVESRWGARLPQELADCADDDNKKQWYAAEQWLRNQTDRRYDVQMNFSLEQLTGPLPGVGVATPPDVDIVGYLKSQM